MFLKNVKIDSINQFTLSLWIQGFCQCMPVRLDPTYTAEQMVKKLLRAENGISHIQSSSAKSSTLLLTFPGRGGTTPKEKEEESAGGRSEQERKNTQWGFLTSLGLISSSSFPHFVLHGGVLNVFLPFFVSFFSKTFLRW